MSTPGWLTSTPSTQRRPKPHQSFSVDHQQGRSQAHHEFFSISPPSPPASSLRFWHHSHEDPAVGLSNRTLTTPSRSSLSGADSLRRRSSFHIDTLSKRAASDYKSVSPVVGSIDPLTSFSSSTSSSLSLASSINRAYPTSHSNKALAASIKPSNPSVVTKRGGRTHHGFTASEAPYPSACDRAAMDLDVLDQQLLMAFNGRASLIDLKGQEPSRVLDLGCGCGSWILEISKEWQNCQFVGFDLLPLHPNLEVTRPDLVGRVDWVRGNFLTGRLPFPRNHFDYVHIKALAAAVPEDKWDYLLEEVGRVLRPGGALELIEEDILFPRIQPKPIKKQRHHSRPPSSPIPPPNSSAHSDGWHTTTYNLPPGLPEITPLSALSNVSLFTHRTNRSSEDKYSDFSLEQDSPQVSQSLNARPRVSSSIRTQPSIPFLSLSSSLPSAFERPSIPKRNSSNRTTSPPVRSPAEDCEFLEQLFYGMFDRRFINIKPSSILPSLVNIHFRRCITSPPLLRYLPRPKRRRATNAGAGGQPKNGDHDAAALLTPVSIRPNYVDHAPLVNRTRSGRPNSIGGPGLLPGLADGEVDLAQLPTDFNSGSRPQLSSNEGGNKAVRDRVTRVMASQSMIPLHLHRTLAGILACKEAMWEELMTQKGWTNEDFGQPETSKTMRMERADFDCLMERYRSAVQARASMDDMITTRLKWKRPLKTDDMAKTRLEALGDIPIEEYDNMGDYDEQSEGDTSGESDGSEEEERKLGEVFRRVQIFCGFKEGNLSDNNDDIGM